jgi:hypothetical protein
MSDRLQFLRHICKFPVPMDGGGLRGVATSFAMALILANQPAVSAAVASDVIILVITQAIVCPAGNKSGTNSSATRAMVSPFPARGSGFAAHWLWRFAKRAILSTRTE